MPTNETWGNVRDVLADATGIAWDGCHKIYVLMDDNQMAEMADYPHLVLVPEHSAEEALDILCSWYEESCMLRFISAVKTVPGNPNDGFTTLIGQFEDEEEVL